MITSQNFPVSRRLMVAVVGVACAVGGVTYSGGCDKDDKKPAANNAPGNGAEQPKPSSGAPAANPASYPNTPDGLKKLVQDIHAAQRSGDTKTAAALMRSLMWPPDEARLKKALKDDAPSDALTKLMAVGKQPAPPEEMLAKAMAPNDPKRTEIQVHGATTEQILAYEKGTAAYNEFPGGAKRVAQMVLRPGVTFYEVEAVEPGQDAGTKWHLFFHDGTQWTMLGPAWRTLGE